MHHSFVTKHESNLITGQCCMYCNHKNVIVDSLRMQAIHRCGSIVDQDQRGELKLHQSHFWARVGVVWWNMSLISIYLPVQKVRAPLGEKGYGSTLQKA
jgi:hypothetical protein